MQDAILAIPKEAWTPAYDAEGLVPGRRLGRRAHRHPDLSAWPNGMRLIVRKERPHPGAQLRFTDIDGHRFTCFATSTKGGQLADLELRHRRRAGARTGAKDTGLRNLPLHGYAQNQIWCEIVALACDLLAWMAMLAPARPGPPLGTETAPAAVLLRRRAPCPRRPPPAAPPRQNLALGTADHRRDHPPAGPRTRLTSQTDHYDQERDTTVGSHLGCRLTRR
jgi:hypothetical protein